ncbi:MAG: GMC family oxidoreductase [Ornithinimicrobium sp.]|uniref:FAD-dependent oxidoreductase n=1 Tax=Ornithinimicrobium sp. TaxID=1977084 RepID=UPI0026E0A819|nr:GMC family oxidoreductase [Ornithinimicrobium sp.]MDO5740288.1 GMC family oxidoreductase [Ornithinimicrobium sp.]
MRREVSRGLRPDLHTDVIVVGSGFGGSVAALRLREKGYGVTVLEAGRRFADEDFAATSWDLRRFLWLPALGLRGIQRIHLLKDVLVLAGAGVGGGSLNYANTLYRPQTDDFYRDPQWGQLTDWREELGPHYDTAERMLGVVTNPTVTTADEIYREVAQEMGVGHTFRLAPVGVFFGREGAKEPGVDVEDPYFGGEGPRRRGCLECGECMVGCRHGAKNTLVKNYLWFAERLGATIIPDTTVTSIRPRPEGGYVVTTVRSGSWLARRRPGARLTRTADQVVLAAGAWGTQHLLHRLKCDGDLPALSDRLGVLTRTNSEALLGAVRARGSAGPDLTQGVAITSSFHPDARTHIEPVRYGRGQNAMGLLTSPYLVDGPTPGTGRAGGTLTGRALRAAGWVRAVAREPRALLDHVRGLGDWSERTTIALVMQTLDNSITVRAGRGLFGYHLTSGPGHGQPNPTWIPVAHDAVRRLAQRLGGRAGMGVGDIVNVPMTAHFIGGAVIGESAKEGVVDPYHRVHGYPGLHIVDGSTISANLGVNPSLTITAQAERALSMWPSRGEPDPRPEPGAAYRSMVVRPGRVPGVPAPWPRVRPSTPPAGETQTRATRA